LFSSRSPEETCADRNEHAADCDKRTALPGSNGGRDEEEETCHHH
jgi:hypothetical protein